MNETPASLGYRMPAEWEPHSSTWLAWPHNNDTWSSVDLYEVEIVYIEIIRNLIDGENINLLVKDQATQSRVTSIFINNEIWKTKR